MAQTLFNPLHHTWAILAPPRGPNGYFGPDQASWQGEDYFSIFELAKIAFKSGKWLYWCQTRNQVDPHCCFKGLWWDTDGDDDANDGDVDDDFDTDDEDVDDADDEDGDDDDADKQLLPMFSWFYQDYDASLMTVCYDQLLFILIIMIIVFAMTNKYFIVFAMTNKYFRATLLS